MYVFVKSLAFVMAGVIDFVSFLGWYLKGTLNLRPNTWEYFSLDLDSACLSGVEEY